jgi:hypothetical protein
MSIFIDTPALRDHTFNKTMKYNQFSVFFKDQNPPHTNVIYLVQYSGNVFGSNEQRSLIPFKLELLEQFEPIKENDVYAKAYFKNCSYALTNKYITQEDIDELENSPKSLLTDDIWYYHLNGLLKEKLAVLTKGVVPTYVWYDVIHYGDYRW